jgi:phosphopantothenoylcysteine synthetase/decarboxylase
VGFGAADNEVYVVGRERERFVPRASKEEVARVILESLMAEMDEER